MLGTALLLATPGLAAAATPAAPRYGENTYTLVGLPQYLTAPTTFSVEVSGPAAVCGMEYANQSDTAAPWTFTVSPADRSTSNYVDITLCDGGSDWISAETTVPFQVSRDLFMASEGARTIDVTNDMDVPAVATLTDRRGTVVAQSSVDPGGTAALKLPGRDPKRTTTYRLQIAGANGVTMTRRVVVAKGWTALGGPDLADAAVFPQCSTIPWYYDGRREPGNAGGMPRDIALALKVLQRTTNLRFTRVQDPDKALLTFNWRKLGSNGPSALGGYATSGDSVNGSVTFNTQDYWPTDRYAGIGNRHGSPADRGWLVVHEVMHSLGFGHVSNPTAIMAPINRGQHTFTRGDLEGLRTLYPKGVCPV